MVKQFSTVRDTQRGSQSYMEKRRGRRDIELTRRRRGEVKRGETILASNQFPKCSPQPGTHREIHKVEKIRRRGVVEVTWGENGESKEERSIKPVIKPLSKNGY